VYRPAERKRRMGRGYQVSLLLSLLAF
jgi:hypothetical protein